jgi:hypothetical protein
MRHRFIFLAVIAAALATVAPPTPPPAVAGTISPTYTLTVDQSLAPTDPSATTFAQAVADAQAYQQAVATAQANNTTPNVSPPQIIAKIIPPGALQGASSSGGASGTNPLNFDQAATTYSTNGIVVDLLSPIQKDGSQYIGFSLFGAPLQPGQQIVFSLADPNLISNPPQFQPIDSSGNPDTAIHIALDPTTSGSDSSGSNNTGSGSTPTPSSSSDNSVPEPLSLVLWSTLAGAGLWSRRRRTPVAGC